MNVKPADTRPPEVFAPIRRAFLEDTLELNFARLGLDSDFLLVGDCVALINGEPYWKGILAVDCFDPRLQAPPKGESRDGSVARHILSCTPFCLSLADQARNPVFVQSLTAALSKTLSANTQFGPVRADRYVAASPAALLALPPGDFCIYCGYSYLPDRPFATRHRVTIVSRHSAPHRLVCHLPMPAISMVALEAWPECGSFALADWATDHLKSIQSEGVVPRRWQIALWESLHGTTRPERLFDAVLSGQRFVVMPAEGGGLRVAALTTDSVQVSGAKLLFRLGGFPSGTEGMAWDQVVFSARFADPDAARAAHALILGAVEPRIDRLEDLPLKGCAYVYYFGADHRRAGVTCWGEAGDYRDFWDGRFAERAEQAGPDLGAWRQICWQRPRATDSSRP